MGPIKIILLAAGLIPQGLRGQEVKPLIEEYPSPLVRERQVVVVRGVPEIWEMRWKEPPKPACEPNEISLTCPCIGFAYGEGGELTLVRIRLGVQFDSLDLMPL